MVKMFGNIVKVTAIAILCLNWIGANAKIDTDSKKTLHKITKQPSTSKKSAEKLQFWPGLAAFHEDARRSPKKKQAHTEKTTTHAPVVRQKDSVNYANGVNSVCVDIVRPGSIEFTCFLISRPTPEKEKPREPLVDEYLSPYGIMSQMMRILNKFENTNITSEVLGRTAEYNDIVLFKITAASNESSQRFRAESKYMDEAPEKKIVFIVHGLTVMGLSLLNCLVEEDKVKILISYYLAHLDKFDIFLIPIANPDGYVASRTGGFWNKNRSPQKDCPGVMLDRNFDVAWNQSHQLSSCSQAYPGPSPFSEAETRAVRDVFHYHGHKIIGYIHVHAGAFDTSAFKGDAILYPKGFTDVQSDDDKYIDLKGEVDEAMKNASFQVMSVNVDTLYNWYGKVFGSSVDYASTVYGIPYALEFVMQLYASNLFVSEDEDLVDYTALTQIWRRMINVVFNYFARSLQTNVADSRRTGIRK